MKKKNVVRPTLAGVQAAGQCEEAAQRYACSRSAPASPSARAASQSVIPRFEREGEEGRVREHNTCAANSECQSFVRYTVSLRIKFISHKLDHTVSQRKAGHLAQ
ncbi:hypothetical protein EVAR_70949_1 [Eumeta japonica]|uniref:Uncharacterized protein n=1 Tax=Eumeta variegata TaxID=151549 RepID=A0A4C2A0S4_EUMVA|nr:hypothetical protein EVAR_70949_1 [Eumeta japonica]